MQKPYTFTFGRKLKDMRKLLLFIAVILAASCSRTPVTQDVVFRRELVEAGSMTRSADHGEILSMIESSYTSFAVDLYTNEENNQFIKMEFGRTYTVPVGTFHVLGYNSITMTGNPNSKYSLAKSPHFYVDTYVTIQYGTSEYALPVQVRSAAVVFDRSEVSQIQYKGQSGSYIAVSNSDLVLSDNYGLFFVNGYFEGQTQVAVKVVPKTGAYKETEFIFAYDEVGTGSATYVKLDSGKYYVLHPSGVTEISGSFTMSIPSWTCGLD